ncbi:MAG TPA: outer membrane lipoprotein-sorting protein [Candidatus Binatia bacterium]|jgi:hypothetical protein
MKNSERGTGNAIPVNAGCAACTSSLGALVWALILVLLCALPVGPVLADTLNLEQFLREAEEAARVTVPVRGDGQFEVTSPEGTRRDQVALVIRPAADAFIELQQEGIKTLLLYTSGQAFYRKAGATRGDNFAPDASFAESDFTREDLEPFRLSHYTQPRIADDSATELTVMLVPKVSQYSLEVITFDRQKKVPLKTLYYRDTLSNLVKMGRHSDYVLIGRKWMPTTISMETFKLRTRAAFRLRWGERSNVPSDLFDPASLPRASASLWSVAPPAP